jgi:transitional endoplasmic reticulum ATPase
MPANNELIQALRAALETSPEAVPLRKHLADLLMEAGEFAEAAKIYRQTLDLAPDDDEIRLSLAEAYYQQGEKDVALVVLERLMNGPDPAAQVFLLAARLYLESGEVVQAAQAYQKAIAQDPELADPELQRQLTLTAVVPPPREESEPEAEEDELVFVVADESSPVDLVERPRITFEDVGGMEKVKEEIRMKIIYPLTHPEIYQAYGKTVGGGILMYGPPGCGKTYLARATAGEVRAHFVSVGLHDVLDMYIGQSEQKLHKIFELARQHTPCVLFFDEVDALGASRADMRYSAGRQVINQFLAELDGVDTSNEGVLILAATNAPWHVDPAMRRPGRFDRVLFVPPPDASARAAILHIMLEDKPTGKIDYSKLARQTEGFSGADLKGIIDVAVENKLREAMRTGVPKPLTTGDLHAVLKTVRPTIKEWFATARNYAIYSNQGGVYDDILEYLKIFTSSGAFPMRSHRES